MISDSMLNNIPCVDCPGVKLMDTKLRAGDISILFEQIQDYQAMCQHRIATAIAETQELPQAAKVFAHATSASSMLPASSDAPSASTPRTEHERIQQLMEEMRGQRERLSARLGKPVSQEALQACLALLDRFPDNFRPPGHDCCKLGVFRIVLKDKSKFHIALPRRVNPIMLTEIRRQVEELVAVGTIERCNSRPSSVYAIVMARRPNAPGKYRLCIDISPGNDNTVPHPYSVPEVQQALDRLSGHKLYSTFDFSAWFSQFELAEEDRDKMAFVVPGDNFTPPQIYRYKRVCFGALNATYFCQRQLQEALEVFPGCESIYPFVDDIVLFADSLEEMLQKLESFMLFCRHHNLRLNRAKTELASTAVRHVGFILTEEGQFLDPTRVESLTNIGAPKNLDGLKSLLGSFGFIRGWLADMAGVAAPLTDLIGDTARRLKFEWGPKQEAALEALKIAAWLAPAKAAPDYTLPFEVYVDASDVGVAAVLVQWRPDAKGTLVPMAILHKSRRWADREARWEVACREMYALRYGLYEFREYLHGCPNVSVFSDHLNLVNGLWKHSNPKIVRWRMFLESMRPFTLKHIRGTDQMQMAADSLSRLHIKNLFLEKNEEEKDPAVIRMMERGEGEDDANMFNDSSFSATIETQTDFLQALYGTVPLCNVSRVPCQEELRLASQYGIGFDIIEQMGWSPSNHFDPIQLRTCSNHEGIGFEHHKRRKFTSVNTASTDPTLEQQATSQVISCVHAADWTSEEERQTSSAHFSHDVPLSVNSATAALPFSSLLAAEQARDSTANPATRQQLKRARSKPCADVGAINVEATDSLHQQPPATTTAPQPSPGEISAPASAIEIATSSQTTPQDFRDASYRAAGGFPLEELLKKAHDSTHPGFITTWRRVIRAVGPQTSSEAIKTKDQVRRYCDACLCCQKLQPARAKLLANIGSIRQRPFTSYAFDVVTLSKPDANDVRYILCCVDSFSRAVELYGLKQANAPTVLECLVDVLSRWGRAAELRCDNAKAFTSAMVTALLKRVKVAQHLTAPYSHQSNGQVENCNRRVMDILRAMILDDRLGPNTQLRWSLLLPEVRRVLMTRTITQHGLTPNDLAYMHCPETEASIFDEEAWMPPTVANPDQAEPDWLVNLHQQHQSLIDICDEKQHEMLEKLAELNAKSSNQSKLRQLQVHDFVLVKLTDRPQQKTQPRWTGPYLVLEFPDNDSSRPVVTLQHLATKAVGEFHLSMLKFCDMSLMKQVEDAIPYAAKDNFEYEIEAIMQHIPSGPRKTASGTRSKSEYEFKVLWKDIPLGIDNPSWEPYSNESMRKCAPYIEYVKRPEIAAALGDKF
jgi:transposase InsO family protein